MEKANLTLYTAIGEPKRILTAVQEKFREVTQDFSTADGQTILTLQDNTRIVFTLTHRRDNPDFIDSHTEGMANYFSMTGGADETLKQNVLRQIGCFNCVTGIVFETDDNTGRTNYILNTLFDVAREINGFLLYPNMCIYNSQGKLVFSAEGKSELTEFIPIANTDLIDGQRPEESGADKERRERSQALLKENNIPYLPHLPSDILESEVAVKSREEMIQRAAALFAIAVYSEVMLSEAPDREEALGFMEKLDEMYGVRSCFTPAEDTYIANPTPEQNECIQFVWRYECCAVLLWAAGIVEELPYPSDICDVPVTAALFWQHTGPEALLSKGIPRTEEEILDAADLTLRYDWACVDARTHGQEAPALLDGGIVMERHYAFNWLTGACNQADWDNIQPAT